MPRRNRNAHAPTIDTDELAEHAAQLATELSQAHRITATGWAGPWHATRYFQQVVTINDRP